jgi:hypothetical protein
LKDQKTGFEFSVLILTEEEVAAQKTIQDNISSSSTSSPTLPAKLHFNDKEHLVLIKEDDDGQHNICGWWKFKDDGSVKFHVIEQPHIKSIIFENGYPMTEGALFKIIKNKKKKNIMSELPADATGFNKNRGSFNIEAEEERLRAEEEEDQRRQRERVKRRRLLAEQKALSSFGSKFALLQRFIDEEKKSPTDRTMTTVSNFSMLIL